MGTITFACSIYTQSLTLVAALFLTSAVVQADDAHALFKQAIRAHGDQAAELHLHSLTELLANSKVPIPDHAYYQLAYLTAQRGTKAPTLHRVIEDMAELPVDDIRFAESTGNIERRWRIFVRTAKSLAPERNQYLLKGMRYAPKEVSMQHLQAIKAAALFCGRYRSRDEAIKWFDEQVDQMSRDYFPGFYRNPRSALAVAHIRLAVYTALGNEQQVLTVLNQFVDDEDNLPEARQELGLILASRLCRSGDSKSAAELLARIPAFREGTNVRERFMAPAANPIGGSPDSKVSGHQIDMSIGVVEELIKYYSGFEDLFRSADRPVPQLQPEVARRVLAITTLTGASDREIRDQGIEALEQLGTGAASAIAWLSSDARRALEKNDLNHDAILSFRARQAWILSGDSRSRADAISAIARLKASSASLVPALILWAHEDTGPAIQDGNGKYFTQFVKPAVMRCARHMQVDDLSPLIHLLDHPHPPVRRDASKAFLAACRLAAETIVVGTDAETIAAIKDWWKSQ